MIYVFEDTKTGKVYRCSFNHKSIAIEFARISGLKLL